MFEQAFITGASSGIGAELARQLARRGTRVHLAARRVERLESLASEIDAAGGAARCVPLDVRESGAVHAAIAEAERESGGLDLVIANAGVGRATHAKKLSWEQIEETLQVNVTGAFATLHAGLQCMLPRDRGTLCAISSLASYAGFPTSGAYAASKAALSTFMETLSVDLSRSAIRLVDVRPGFVVSEMTASQDQSGVPMPFKWPTERAAGRILAGLDRGEQAVVFPAPLALPLRASACLPRPLFRYLMSRNSPAKRDSDASRGRSH